jgi:glycine/D-amino acid oxidase-like deaminating enzyme
MAGLRIGKPIWVARNRERFALTYPRLTGSHEVDVAIVGGGMTGCTIAALFARAGVRVAVIEASHVGAGSTAASTALLLRELDLGLVELTKRFGGRKARRIWELSAQSVEGLVKLIRKLGIPCELADQESVYYTIDRAKLGELRAEYERRRRAGFAATWLTPGALRRLTGIAGQGAIHTRGNAQLNPYQACHGLLRAAVSAGAAAFERSPVTRIDVERDGVTVRTARGSLDARQAIVATGYATPGFQPLVGRFRMLHSYVIATAPLDRGERRELGLDRVMLWEAARPYHFARWTPDGRLMMGGEDRPVVRGERRAAAFRHGTESLRAYFETLLPSLAGVTIDHAWEGLFAMTPDGLPYIGAHRRYPRHLFALGYGGNGMTFGFLAARMLLEQWQGIRSADHRLFAFSR